MNLESIRWIKFKKEMKEIKRIIKKEKTTLMYLEFYCQDISDATLKKKALQNAVENSDLRTAEDMFMDAPLSKEGSEMDNLLQNVCK